MMTKMSLSRLSLVSRSTSGLSLKIVCYLNTELPWLDFFHYCLLQPLFAMWWPFPVMHLNSKCDAWVNNMYLLSISFLSLSASSERLKTLLQFWVGWEVPPKELLVKVASGLYPLRQSSCLSITCPTKTLSVTWWLPLQPVILVLVLFKNILIFTSFFLIFFLSNVMLKTKDALSVTFSDDSRLKCLEHIRAIGC